MVGAIKVAKNEKEYAILKKEMDADPRKVSDLFVDRYGAQPMHKAFLIKQERFDKEVLSAHKLVNVAELFKSESIVCLYCSIPIKELFPDSNIKYRKVELKDDALTEKYGIKTLPALLFFKDGKMLGKIEGAYQPEKAEELKSLIKPLLGK